MALRAATTHPAAGHPAAVCPPQASTARTTIGRRSAGPRPVPSLARPATDIHVNAPDAAQTPAPGRQPAAPARPLRPVRDGMPPAPRISLRAGSRAVVLPVFLGGVVRGIASTGIVGCSIVPVRSVAGTRSRLVRLR